MEACDRADGRRRLAIEERNLEGEKLGFNFFYKIWKKEEIWKSKIKKGKF